MRLFEEVHALDEPEAGLHGYIVLHDTSRGPATGGIRLRRYGSDMDALEDGIRLARAMTFKAVAAELPVGGGKIVLFEPPGAKRDETLAAVGRALEEMRGRFLAGRDVGLPVGDGAKIRAVTRHMVDESSTGVGDLNEKTALGVLEGARAAMESALDRTSFDGVRVVLQGVGGVGSWLARMLVREGAILFAADTNAETLEALARDVPFTRVDPDDVLRTPCEVFAPCALGSVLTLDNAESLNARIVAGSANNVLGDEGVARILHDRGVVYVPDLLINAGALIQGVRFLLYGERDSTAAIHAIRERTAALLERARAGGVPPWTQLQSELAGRGLVSSGNRGQTRPRPARDRD